MAFSSLMPWAMYPATAVEKSELSPMMAASERMLATSVNISSLASTPACLAVSVSRLFQLFMVFGFSN